jgi:HK97 family phage portal protein
MQASGTRMPADWFFDALAGPRNESGVRVNPRTVLQHGPVYQAIALISGDFSRLDERVMLERGDREERQMEHPVEWLLNYWPNSFQTPGTLKETLIAWALGWGNGIARIVYDRGRPVALLPLDPSVTWPERIGQDEWLIITHDFQGKSEAIVPEETFHIRGLATYDGFWGESAATLCKRRLGSGIAADTFAATTWGEGALPGGLIELEMKLDAETRQDFRRDWNREHQGPQRGSRVGILPFGMRWKDRSMTNQDAELFNSLRLDREFVADLFLIPHSKMGALETSSVRANIEEQSKEWVQCLKRWGKRFEQETERKLLGREAIRPRQRRFFVSVDYRPLIQKTAKEEAEEHSLLVRSEIENPNEARKSLDMNPRPGGDEFGNPAINPNQQQDLQQPVTPEVEELVRSQVRACLLAECGRIETHGNRAKDFRSWAAKFYATYGEHAERYLEAACRVAGVDWRKPAVDHADVVLTRIKLGQQGTEWIEERADAFADHILNGRASHG